jgi:hypothetical protein
LAAQCIGILQELRDFAARHGASLPAPATEAIQRVVDYAAPKLTDTSGGSGGRQERISAAMIALAGFEGELSYLIRDAQAYVRTRTERAFLHLQRSIVVDGDLRRRWQTAFGEGEVACEKLGAVHMLGHGIWPFKVDAAGARTDLVYQEPLSDDGQLRVAEGLVLTEWKLSRAAGEVESLCEQARTQARKYAAGALAGVELTSTRYIVVVSERQLRLPGNVTEGAVAYRHMNIAVTPGTPSRP